MKQLISAMLIIAAMLCAALAFADPLTMSECIYRSEIALKVAQAVDAGTPLEKIELHANDPASTPEEQAEHDKFFAEFKGNIAEAIKATPVEGEQHAERVAQTLLEACAYEIGVQAREQTAHDVSKHNAQVKLGDNALALYKLAATLSKLPVGELPNVQPLSHDKLVEFGKEVLGVSIPSLKAMQFDNDVFIDESLDMKNIQNVSVLFHEFVHHLQWVKSGRATNCAEWKDRELQAYHLQNEMLYKSGHPLVLVPTMNCNEGK